MTQVSTSDAQLTVSATQLASASPIVAFVITSSGFSCSGHNANFSSCSFALTAPGGGPPSVVQIPAVTDTGTISVAINGGATASYTWKPTDTWSAVQSGLIAAINLQYGGSLTASPSNYGVQLTSKQPGYATNWPVAVSYTSSNPLGTSPAESSYSPTATNMAGGITAGPGASAGSSYTTVVYTPGGSKLATYTNGVAASTLQAAEIPLPGGGTAMYNSSGLNYLRHSDWLGSSRLATTWGHTVYAKTAYAPFGETYNTYGTDASFTGEDVDPSSSYFNFLYRKFDPVAGRWTSPDPSGLASASLANPQSLNRYAYVLNSPLTTFDPNGLDGECAETGPNGVFGYVICPVPDASYEGLPPGEVLPGIDEWEASQFDYYGESVDRYLKALKNNYWDPNNPNAACYDYWAGSYDPNCGATASGTQSTTNQQNNTNLFQHWPFNGDLVPFTRAQDGVCSAGPLLGPAMDSNPGMLAACQWHDNQYASYNCNWTSWIPALPGPCTAFNVVLVARVFGALFGLY